VKQPQRKLTLLIRTRLKSLRNEWWRKPRKRIQLLIFAGMWAWIIYWFTRVMWTAFATLKGLPAYASALEQLPGSVFLGFLIMLVVSGATVALSAFFLSGELEYLLTTPIPRTTVFNYRLLETAFLNATYLLIFGVPTTIALGLVYAASFLYYLVAAAVLFAFLVLATDLGVLVMLGVVRVLPPRRAREILSAFLGLMFLAFWFGSDAIRARFFDPTSPHFDAARLETVKHVGRYLSASFLPSSWLGDILLNTARGATPAVLVPLILLLVAAVAVHHVTARLADSIWARGATVVHRKTRTEQQVGVRRAEPSARFGMRLLLAREWRMFSRETQQLTRIAILAGMAVLFPLLGTGAESGAWWTPFLVSTILGGFAAATLGTTLVPIERRAFWFLKIAPGGVRKVMLAKGVLAWLVGSLVLVASNAAAAVRNGLDPSLMALVLLGGVFLAGALASVGLGVGAFFARFDWEHPKRVLKAPGGLIYMLGTLLIVGAAVALPALGALLAGDTSEGVLAGLFALTSAILAAVSFPAAVGLGVARLEKLEWTF